MTDKPSGNLIPAMYSYRIHDIVCTARTCGYAIAIHGSMQRDLDIIAVPWVVNARSPEILVKRLCETLDCTVAGEGTKKPHNRIAYTLLLGGRLFVDLSIMARQVAK